MSKSLLRDLPDNVRQPFAGATAGDVAGVVDNLSDADRFSLNQAISYADRMDLSDEDFADDLEASVEVVAKLRSFLWPAVA
jgi:hypothetical protein